MASKPCGPNSGTAWSEALLRRLRRAGGDVRAFPGLRSHGVGLCAVLPDQAFRAARCLESLTFETGVRSPLAAIALAVQPRLGVSAGESWRVWALIAGCDVLTAVPLAHLLCGQACGFPCGRLCAVHHADHPVAARHGGAGRAGYGASVRLIWRDLAGIGDVFVRSGASFAFGCEGLIDFSSVRRQRARTVPS